MGKKGRPITTVNENNDLYLLNYFTRLMRRSENRDIFFQDPALSYEAEKEFENIKMMSSLLARKYSPEFDQEKQNQYHLCFARWIDTYITEQGFQRCLNSIRQFQHRRFPKNRKKVHMDIPGDAYDDLVVIAGELKLSRQDTLVRILKEAYHFYCLNK
ncbi:MAG: hypothetical protein K2Q14_02970 [Gammaproteobacteria bacterium]|nr:hypothetical protein [Gammaproteobacteria bacterium]